MFAALPKELQEELKAAYSRATGVHPQVKMCKSADEFPEGVLFFLIGCFYFLFFLTLILLFDLILFLVCFLFFCPSGFSAVEQKNPLLQLKQSGAGIGSGRVKRRYKRKNAVSPLKKGASPLKKRPTTNSPAKSLPPTGKSHEPINIRKASLSSALCI